MSPLRGLASCQSSGHVRLCCSTWYPDKSRSCRWFPQKHPVFSHHRDRLQRFSPRQTPGSCRVPRFLIDRVLPPCPRHFRSAAETVISSLRLLWEQNNRLFWCLWIGIGQWWHWDSGQGEREWVYARYQDRVPVKRHWEVPRFKSCLALVHS